jgi:alpha-ribazole phosphatase
VTLYLVRHPRPRIPSGTCYGRLDAPLDAPASTAAQRIRTHLPPAFVTWPLWTSPARRCRDLAAALHPAPRMDERLHEMDFGDWEGRSWNDIGPAALDAWAANPLDFTPPGGESAHNVRARILAFVRDFKRDGVRDAVCITHAGVMRMLCATRLEMPETWLGRDFPYEMVLKIEQEPIM